MCTCDLFEMYHIYLVNAAATIRLVWKIDVATIKSVAFNQTLAFRPVAFKYLIMDTLQAYYYTIHVPLTNVSISYIVFKWSQIWRVLICLPIARDSRNWIQIILKCLFSPELSQMYQSQKTFSALYKLKI